MHGDAGQRQNHHIEIAAAFAHRLVLLAGGRVVAEGRPSAVFTETNLEAAYGPGLVVGTHPTAPCPVVLAAP